MLNRRTLITSSLLGATAAMSLGAGAGAKPAMAVLPKRPSSITAEERARRIGKAQKLMLDAGVAALLVEPGASLVYFTGVKWSRSERLTCAVIPAEGDLVVVTPFFEEPSIRESLAIPAEVRTWLEHEDPYAVIAGWLSDRKIKGPVAVEETTRFFIADGLRRATGIADIANGASIVRGCRMIKTAAELALMQHANDITIEAYRRTIAQITTGMRHTDVAEVMKRETETLGGVNEFAGVLIGDSAAYPHGSGKPQIVKPGEIILMDCGCSVDGYQSDISRTFVHGTASARQRKVWDQMKAGQALVHEKAQLGVAAGDVDAAVRAYYESLGYGPDYRLPGLSHRTGHGIGLDGHEPINLVRGEKGKLAVGMCFSNEPGIYIPGEFGVRLEDCFHMTESGPQWFSKPSVSIDEPV